jgi:hypothetical protein
MTTPTRIHWLVAATLLVAAPSEAAGQTLRGRVVDSSNESGVEGATLQLLAPDSQTVIAGLSRETGAFSLLAPRAGDYLVRVERIGYQTSVLGPLRLRGGGFLEVTIALGPAALPVEGVNVEVEGRLLFLENAGFYDRRQRMNGQFLDRKEIEALHREKLSDVLNTFRGVRIVRSLADADVVLRGAIATALTGATDCNPPIFMDGVLLAPQFPPGPKIRTNLDDLLSENIEAVEVYVGQSTVPAQFAVNGAACGAIVLWRRR